MSLPPPSADDMAQTHAAAFKVDRPWSATEFADLLASKGAQVTGDAASFALIRVVADEAELLTIATHPDARRQGRAAKALHRAQVAAKEAGATSLFLEVAADNHPALQLYQNAGFTQVGQRRGYYARANQPAVDALILRCELAG